MATTKTRYSVTSTFTGKLHTRNSTNSHYTHAVIVASRRENGTIWETVSYCGSMQLAQARLRQETGWRPDNIGGQIIELEK